MIRNTQGGFYVRIQLPTLALHASSHRVLSYPSTRLGPLVTSLIEVLLLASPWPQAVLLLFAICLFDPGCVPHSSYLAVSQLQVSMSVSTSPANLHQRVKLFPLPAQGLPCCGLCWNRISG